MFDLDGNHLSNREVRYETYLRRLEKRTPLQWALLNRYNYTRWVKERAPVSATAEEWELWRQWVNARRDQFGAAIKTAREHKAYNQRSKANDRKYKPNS